MALQRTAGQPAADLDAAFRPAPSALV